MSLRSNSEIYGFYKDLNVVDDIKIRRLVWTSHIIRMEEERIKKEVLNGKFHYRCSVRKSRRRWVDVV